MSDDSITIEINGQELEAKPGQMIIEVADAAGINIPRFCYHEKLSISANCRMCLVEVEKTPKPMPACATPIMPGMKVLTNSVKAAEAQKAIMEFLLINHPLDCPICDQGGECELQDISVSHGEHSSEYVEIKRVVTDKDIGPLIETEMTRCIQCTRCVRFGEEIAGMRELGATGRSEAMQIGTYIEKSLESELSGNAIDVCPVGALTAKPSRYKARAWEITQSSSIAPHDCVGSNVFLHSFQNEVMRVVPQENDAINECWISDRDRFSYEGLNAQDRQTQPMIKNSDGSWNDVSWDTALEAAGEMLEATDPNEVGVLASASSSTEELYLLQKLMRNKGISNLDHRLRQIDFSDQGQEPQFPWLGTDIEGLEEQEVFLFVGSDVRRDQPMINHRVRKAVAKGAKVFFLNPYALTHNYDVSGEFIRDPAGLVNTLASIASYCGDLPSELEALSNEKDDSLESLCQALKDSDKSLVVLGSQAVNFPHYATLRALAAVLAESAGAKLGYLPEAANTVGAWLTGMVPHRVSGGENAGDIGQHTSDMLMSATKTYVLYNVDPQTDCADPQIAEGAMHHAKVIAFTAFASDKLRAVADILLPIATASESSGTFINAEGKQQSYRAAVKQRGDSKPGWKVLRVMGNVLGVTGFEYMSSQDVLDEFNANVESKPDNTRRFSGSEIFDKPEMLTNSANELQKISHLHAFSIDAVTQRATSLQKTYATERNSVSMNSQDIQAMGLDKCQSVTVKQGDARAVMTLVSDDQVPKGCISLLAATNKSSILGASFGTLEISGDC